MKTKNYLSILLLIQAAAACGHKKNDRRPPDVVAVPPQVENARPVHFALTDKKPGDENAFVNCINGRIHNDQTCQIPFLQKTEEETWTSTILQHTLVSDDWVTARFKTYLEQSPPEIQAMFSCVKGVMISGSIRPSYFTELSNSIYLDAGDFAETDEERATVDPDPDFRDAYFQDIAFNFSSIMTRAGKSIFLDGDALLKTRARLDHVIIHELAHACDFKAEALGGTLLSKKLPETPDSLAADLSHWLWGGDTASKSRAVRAGPAAVGTVYAAEPFTHLYGYMAQTEHLAMLVQQRLFLEIHGITNLDVILDRSDERALASKLDKTVRWGMQSKLCQPEVFALSTETVNRVLPLPFALKIKAEDCQAEEITPGVTLRQILYKDPVK